MGIQAEFQEREYESLFIQELAKLGSFTWSPGQTDEFILGFDGASWVDPWKLLDFGFATPRQLHPLRKLWPYWHLDFWDGRELHPSLFEEWGKFADKFFPKKTVNFFVQHKRPYQTSELGDSGEHWGQAYFEYIINKAQQSRLEQLQNQLGSSSVVTYSCAAFMKKAELWAHEKAGKIIENSNFVSASKLSGHSRYTYVAAGHEGFANADPTVVTDTPIIKRLTAAYEESDYSLTAQIKRAGNSVQQIMNEEDSNRTGLYFQLLNRVRGDVETESEADSLLDSIYRVAAFNSVNSTSWAIVTAPDRPKG